MSSRQRIVALTLYSVLAVGRLAGAGMVNGNDWKAWPPDARATYVVGTVDGWQVVDTAGKGAGFGRLVACVEQRKMTGEQIFAIVEKYMAEHPEKWHLSMALLVFVALVEVCK